MDSGLEPPKRLKPHLNLRIRGERREFEYRLTTNADGFRNGFSLPSTAVGDYTVLFLGDSQTVGVGVDDAGTFPSRVGELKGIQVLNAACYGYSTLESARLLETLYRKDSPRTVVLGFFAGNDPYENYAQAAAAGEPSAGKKSWKGLKDYLGTHSYFYNSLIRLRKYETVNRLLYRTGFVSSTPPEELVVFRKGEDSKKELFWRVTREVILRMDEEVKKHGGRFVLLFIPDRFQVDDLYWEGWKQKYRLNDADFDRSDPNRRMSEFSSRHGIFFLDVTEKLRAEEKAGRHPYWTMDSHLSPHGNEVIAEAVSDFLETEI
jgi:hypothetical protein